MKKSVGLGYDEKRVPSRLAAEYTNFGWVRARNRISEELDRKTKGIVLSPSQDGEYVESIRRKKRFGYNAELVSVENEYMRIITSNKVYGRGAGFLLFLGSFFLLLTIVCALLTFIPKYPTTVAEAEAESGARKFFNNIALKIENAVFYVNEYYVKESDVNKNAGETGTIVTASGELKKAYTFDNDGQLINVDIEGLKEKMNLTEEGDIKIIRCEKSFLDPEDEETAYYRYYIYKETECETAGIDGKAVLGFAPKIMGSIAEKLEAAMQNPQSETPVVLPAFLSSGFLFFLVIFFFLMLIFFIWGGCLQSAKRKNFEHKEIELLSRGQRIVAKMKEEDPSLMSKSQRHFYSWQKLMAGAINMSNVAKNDSANEDDDDADDFGF